LKIEILVGLIVIGVIGAVFIPLAFDPAGVGGIDFIECDDDEIIVYVNAIWVCGVDQTTITEIEQGTFGNENSEFRPHLARGTNVQDPIKNFGEYSIRVFEFLDDTEGEVSWDYLVPEDYEQGEDLEFTVYWFKEDGIADPTILDYYYEEVTGCGNIASGSSPVLTVQDGIEYDFVDGEKYFIIVSSSWGGTEFKDSVETFVQHGTTTFAGSHQIKEPPKGVTAPCNESEDLHTYMWFTLYEPDSVSELEDISIHFGQYLNSIVYYDDVTISIVNMKDFTEGVDYFYDENIIDTPLDDTGSWATPNDASLTFTPSLNQTDWLVLGTANYEAPEVESPHNNQLQTRLNVTGAISNLPLIAIETEDIDEQDLHTFTRLLSLNNTSQTLEIQSQLTGVDGRITENRTSSAIMAINLDMFTSWGSEYIEPNIELTGVDFETEINSVDISVSTDDKSVLIINDFGVFDSEMVEFRTQLDNVDTIPDQTTQSYDFQEENSALDTVRVARSSIEPLSIGNHTITVDASEVNGDSDAQERTLTAIVLEIDTPQPPLSTACLELRLMSVGVGEDLSSGIVPTFDSYREVCAISSGGADILRTFTWNYNSTEIPFEAGDVGVVQLKRSSNSTNDDYIGKVFGLFGELQWIVVDP